MSEGPPLAKRRRVGNTRQEPRRSVTDQSKARILQLSDDVLMLIIKNLSTMELLILADTCLRFKSMCLETKSLWLDPDFSGHPMELKKMKECLPTWMKIPERDWSDYKTGLAAGTLMGVLLVDKALPEETIRMNFGCCWSWLLGIVWNLGNKQCCNLCCCWILQITQHVTMSIKKKHAVEKKNNIIFFEVWPP